MKKFQETSFFNNYSKEKIGEEKLKEKILSLLGDFENTKARVLIQKKSEMTDYNYTDIEFDLEINSYQIVEFGEHNVLVLNRDNLNQNTRLDLDITDAKNAHVTIDTESQKKYAVIQIANTGIWFNFA